MSERRIPGYICRTAEEGTVALTQLLASGFEPVSASTILKMKETLAGMSPPTPVHLWHCRKLTHYTITEKDDE